MRLREPTQVVPDIHLSAQRSDLYDGLTQEVVRLPFEVLLHPGLDVVVLVPHSDLDAIGGVVTFAVKQSQQQHQHNNSICFGDGSLDKAAQ